MSGIAVNTWRLMLAAVGSGLGPSKSVTVLGEAVTVRYTVTPAAQLRTKPFISKHLQFNGMVIRERDTGSLASIREMVSLTLVVKVILIGVRRWLSVTKKK